VGRAGRGLAGTVRISFKPSKLCVEPTHHGRSRRGKKLHFHASARSKSLRKPCLGHESAMSILTRTGERAKHNHLLGLLEGVGAAPLKSKVLSHTPKVKTRCGVGEAGRRFGADGRGYQAVRARLTAHPVFAGRSSRLFPALDCARQDIYLE